MMRDAWRRPVAGPWPDWMDADDQAFAEVIGAARKHVVASSPTDLGWNAERVAGDLVASVRRLKDETEGMILLGGVTLPAALADAGLIDEYVFVAAHRRRARPHAARGTPRPDDAAARRPPRLRVGCRRAALPAGLSLAALSPPALGQRRVVTVTVKRGSRATCRVGPTMRSSAAR
jgi:hypothetical protein